MKIAQFWEAAMEWRVTIEGQNMCGEVQRAEIRIKKEFDRLAGGEIGLSISDGKRIMSTLQELVVKQELATYAIARRICPSCERFRPVKDYTTRKIRTVFGTVEVKSPRWMLCQRCHPGLCMALTALDGICPDRATLELMELTARLGSMVPYRKAGELLAEFLPIEPTVGHVTVRNRTLKVGSRLEEQSLRQERVNPPLACERKQLELTLPDDPLHEFVVSVDTAHVRGNDPEAARNFEVVIARCGRGGRGTQPGHYFATSDTSQREIRGRTMQALQREGYAGHGEITILSDGAEIMKRLPRALPKPTTHIIDWFHLAMKIQPMQQIADHIVRNRSILCERLVAIDRHIKRLKWKLWHGQVDRALSTLERILLDMNILGQTGDFSAARLHSLGQQLLSYIRSNGNAIVDYGARYRSGRRIATSLAESAVNSLVAKRMVKNQQMRWSQKGAHLMLQVRAAVKNGDLRDRHREQPDLSVLPLHPFFRPVPPLLQAA
jgi:hypothetical protein